MSRSAKALLALLVGATAIGFSAVFVRFADVGPSAIGFWRMAFALPFLLVWSWREQGGRVDASPVNGGLPWAAVTFAGLAFSIDVFLFHVAVNLTTIAKASLLGNAAPLILAAIGILFLGDKPSRMVLAALGLSMLGMVFLVKPDNLSGGTLTGDLAGVGAAFSYALYLIAIQRARQRGSSAWISLTSTAICGVGCLALALVFGEKIIPASVNGWLAVIALGVISHALGQGLITVGLGGVNPSLAAVVLIYPAIVSTLAAYLVFSEVPTLVQIVGGGLILAALVMARRG
ncbi:MAG: DMT family transporter [Bosea sp. (in: a-proteobacteria)]